MRAVSKYNKILNAATKVFAKKGFFSARISDIAKEAKIADGTIYLYFDNKQDILLSIFDKEISLIISSISSQLNQVRSTENKLRLFITYHLKVMKKNKNFAIILYNELHLNEKRVSDYRQNEYSKYQNILTTIISDGQETGIFRKDINPDIIKRIIFGAMDEVSSMWNHSLETNYSVEETCHQIETLILRGLLKETTD